MGLFGKAKPQALAGALKILDARQKLLSAIANAEGELSKLIHARVEAEHALVEAETAVAIGEGNQPTVTGAEKALSAAKVATSRQASRLAGLRGAVIKQVSDLAAARAEVKQIIPEHAAAIKAEFAEEWRKASEAWAAVLGKRQRLTALLGNLGLPDPAPAAVELPSEMGEPWALVQQAEQAVQDIENWERFTNGSGGAQVDPDTVFVVTDRHVGMQPGTLVMEASFVPGALRQFLRIEYVRPLTDADWQGALFEATQARLKFKGEAAQADMDARSAEFKADQAARAIPPVKLNWWEQEHPHNAKFRLQDTKFAREQAERAKLRPSDDPHVKEALGH